MRSLLLANLLALAVQETALQDPAARLIAALRPCEPGSAPGAEFLEDARRDPVAVFELLRAGALPPLEGEDQGPLPLGEGREQWLLEGVRALPRAQVLGLARRALAERDDAATRAATLRCIGSVGRAGELEELFRLALPERAPALDERVGEALQRASAEILARDERAFAYLNAHWRSLREELLEPLILAAGEARGAPALEFLAEVIHWRSAHARLALAMVQKCGRSFDPVDETVRVRVRPLLDRARPDLCRAAALALGALDDLESVPDLIELLEQDDGLSANAHWALRRITGLTLCASSETWSRWYAQESAWMLADGEAALARLASEDACEVLAAVRTLSAHALAREELALGLVERLASESSALLVLACRLVPEFGDARAFPDLLALLADEDPEVALAAYGALRAMTERELPFDVEAWKRFFSRV